MAVEAEKMRAISSRNALKTADKQHIADTQQLQVRCLQFCRHVTLNLIFLILNLN